jgi:hypothetical protein
MLALGCTPAERQVLAKDGSKLSADFALCIKAHASDEGATPQTVAVTCLGTVVPDVLQLIADEIDAAKKPTPDAGAP